MPSLTVTSSPGRVAVEVRGLRADQVAALDRHLASGGTWESVLTVRVTEDRSLPAVAGRHRLLVDGAAFAPYFPFEAGGRYHCRFEPPRDATFAGCPSLSQDLRVPSGVTPPPPRVLAVHPSGDEVPENVLRFYVTFSESMQRGGAGAEVAVLGDDGCRVPDVLYRAPLELWSRDMRCLTVLFDPGRLKRQVGPHRELGPPLTAGRRYALVVGTGMVGRTGQPLAVAHRHEFRTTVAVRRPIDVEAWRIAVPSAGSPAPLVIGFPAPLDRAMLPGSLCVVDAGGRPLAGRSDGGRDGTRWTFTPAAAWAPGDYRVQVSPHLEDVCGNDLMAAFDRDVRRDDPPHAEVARTLGFRVS